MVEITNCKEPCFASLQGGCAILTKCKCEGCGFYKPRSCKDWVRIEKGGKAYILPPEEYYPREVYNVLQYL